MHADAAVTGLSRSPATALRNTVQPLADVVNVTLKSKSGQTANHIEGRSSANVLQWSISAVGAALLSALTVTALAGTGVRLVTASAAGLLSTTTASAYGLVSGTGTENNMTMFTGTSTIGDAPGFRYETSGETPEYTISGYNLDVSGTVFSDSGFSASGGNLFIGGVSSMVGGIFTDLYGTGTRIVGAASTGQLVVASTIAGNYTYSGTIGITGAVTLTTLAGAGTRIVTADASGVLSSTTLSSYGGVAGIGSNTRVAYWTAADTISGTSDFTWNGTTLAITGAQTISSTLAVTGTTTLTGVVGVGGAPNAKNALKVFGSITTGADQYGVVSFPTFSSSAVTSGAAGYFQLTTAAASFTMVSGYGIWVDVATKGSGSAITTLYGIKVENQTAGGTNYAIYTGTGQVLLGDAVGIGSTSPTGTIFRIDTPGTALTSTTQNGMVSLATLNSAATANMTAGYFKINSAAASYTTGVVHGLRIDSPTFGSGHSVTTLYGLRIGNQTGGGTNYAINTGTGRVRFGDVGSFAGDTSTDTALTVGGSGRSAVTSGTVQYGIVSDYAPTSGATSAYIGGWFRGWSATASYTQDSTYGLFVASPSKGSGSTMTTLYGLRIDDQSVGGTNYAIWTGLGRISFGDVVAIGTTPLATQALRIAGGGVTSGSSQYGVVSAHVISSGATTSGTALYAQLTTVNSSFTMTAGIGLNIDTPSKGASNTITTLYGLKVDDQTVGGTNYAIYTGAGLVRFGGAVTAVSGIVFNGGGTNLNHYEVGTFTATATGLTTSPTTTCWYTRIGNVVTLTLGSISPATSNATSFTYTGLPAALTPSRTAAGDAARYAFTDNGVTVSDVIIYVTGTTIGFSRNLVGTGWTNTGTKYLASNLTYTYLLS